MSSPLLVTGRAEDPLPQDAARMVSAFLDWMDHHGVSVRMVCKACLTLGHPDPFVTADVDAAGNFLLTCPHRRLVYRGPDPRVPAA